VNVTSGNAGCINLSVNQKEVSVFRFPACMSRAARGMYFIVIKVAGK